MNVDKTEVPIYSSLPVLKPFFCLKSSLLGIYPAIMLK